ncbi:hypothetical protein OG607_34290 [Streptomyces sp. NBC_01537]|uniref:hypothetical protein n=1 Tax=Streptomyces sp. NBC_01537 TaxID=2903896 RepID=UPI00386DF780
MRTRTPTGRWPRTGGRGRWRDAPGSDENRPTARTWTAQGSSAEDAVPAGGPDQTTNGRRTTADPARPALEDGTSTPYRRHRNRTAAWFAAARISTDAAAALWAALACANVLLAVGQFISFRHHSARLAAPEPPPVGAGAGEPVRP